MVADDLQPTMPRRRQLSVCAETVFIGYPLEQRVQQIAESGFLVELWGWEHRNIERLARLHATYAAFTGHLGGNLVEPDAVDRFLEGARRSIAVAEKLQCRNLVLHMTEISASGKVVQPIEHPGGLHWVTAYKALCELAELAERNDITYNLENVNTKVDHPGAPLSRAADTMSLVQAVGSPRIRMLLDLYHAQVEEGNLIDLIRAAAPNLGHVHVADVPGRHEPGTGEINYTNISDVLNDIAYTGPIGLEAFPKDSDQAALDRFREIFRYFGAQPSNADLR